LDSIISPTRQIAKRPGNCTNCHNGPLFTNNDFHNTGVPAADGLPEDYGRATGVKQVMADEFNCMSQYRDADESECSELRYSELEPLNLSEEQIAQIIAFLKTLDGPVNAKSHWLTAPR
jgi:cytochrome c peroxidase